MIDWFLVRNAEYDPEVDALYIHLIENSDYDRTEEFTDGIYLDITKDGKVSGVEILGASSNWNYPKLLGILKGNDERR